MTDEKRPLDPSDRFARTVLPGNIESAEQRKAWGLPENAADAGRYILELNLQHAEGIPGAAAALQTVLARISVRPAKRVAKTYFACELTLAEAHALVLEDER
jgi:hypothetical protein